MTVSVYILKLANNTYYTGMTKDLDKRINQHSSGQSRSTRHHLPLELEYFAECEGYKKARIVEKIIKNTGAKRYLDNMKFASKPKETPIISMRTK